MVLEKRERSESGHPIQEGRELLGLVHRKTTCNFIKKRKEKKEEKKRIPEISILFLVLLNILGLFFLLMLYNLK